MEFRRVLFGKSFLWMLAALLAINTFLFLYQQADRNGDFQAFPDIYHDVVEEYKGLSWEAGLSRAQEFEQIVYRKITEDPQWSNLAENSHRFNATSALIAQYSHLIGYGDYLNKIQIDAKKLQSVSIFGDPQSFSYKNAVKTAEDFSVLKDSPLSFGHDLAVTTVFEDKWADYSCVLVMLAVCAAFLAERREGLWPLIYATQGGRRKLAVQRIFILLSAACIATLLLLGSRILLSGWLFHGLSEWNRSIQSIEMFSTIPQKMTIWQFWLFYVAVKIGGNFLVGAVLWSVLSSITHTHLAICGVGLLLGVEYSCTLILPNSAFALFRYCNIFSYIHFFDVFSSYLNLPVFGLVVSGSDLVLAMLPLLCFAFSIILLFTAEHKHPIARANRFSNFTNQFAGWFDLKFSGGSLFVQEAKKLLLKRKGILLLAALVVVVSQMQPPDREYDPLEIYYQFYQEKYAGPITQTTVTSLQSEMELAASSDSVSALSILIARVESAPEGSWLIPAAPYEAIWSSNFSNYHRSTALIALLFLVLILSPVSSQESQSNVKELIRSMPGGRHRLLWKKHILLGLVTTAVWGIVYGAEIIKTIQYWGAFQCLDAPVCSLNQFRESGCTVSLGAMLALYYCAKLFVMLIVGEICFLLSSLSNKNRDATLLCCGIILIPAALAAIGSPVGESISFLIPLGGVELFDIIFNYA